MTTRARLPDRRAAEAFDFEHDGARYHAIPSLAGSAARGAGSPVAAVLDLIEDSQ
jgi:hypothetical protein